ncbi:hypothetical protein Tco_0188172, partial [Tanacetum coccineum]
MESSSATTAA